MSQTFCPLILRLDFSNPIFAGSRHLVLCNRVYWLLIHRLLIYLKQKICPACKILWLVIGFACISASSILRKSWETKKRTGCMRYRISAGMWYPASKYSTSSLENCPALLILIPQLGEIPQIKLKGPQNTVKSRFLRWFLHSIESGASQNGGNTKCRAGIKTFI